MKYLITEATKKGFVCPSFVGQLGDDYDDFVYKVYLQKWLREGFEINIELIPDENDISKFFAIIYNMNCMGDVNNVGLFDTYEEALEKGLLHSLRLV